MRAVLTVACTVIVMLAIMAGVMMNLPASAQVSATLADESNAEVVVVYVTADGDYKINREGNNPAEILTVASVDGRLEFDLGGKKSFQIWNIVPEDESKIWKMTSDDGWFGLDDSVQTDDDENQVVTTSAVGNEPYNLQGDNGEFVDCGMWYVEPDKKLMTWTGGSSSVHTCFNQPAKDLLEEGYVAEFTMSVESKVRACRSYWSGEDLNGNQMVPYVPAGCWIFTLRPGTYRVHGWAFDPACGIQIGFRAVPEDTDPWNETPTCDNCVWPFPTAKTQPVYRNVNSSNAVYAAPQNSINTTTVATTQLSSNADIAQLQQQVLALTQEVQALTQETAYLQCVFAATLGGTDPTACQVE